MKSKTQLAFTEKWNKLYCVCIYERTCIWNAEKDMKTLMIIADICCEIKPWTEKVQTWTGFEPNLLRLDKALHQEPITRSLQLPHISQTDLFLVWKWYTCEMYLRVHKQSERVSYNQRKRTKATMLEGINPITTKKINWAQSMAADILSSFFIVIIIW